MACPWIDGLTISQVLEQTAAAQPAADAVVFPHCDCRRSYAEFRADVRQVARALLALDVRPGEHVGIWATNWPQWVQVQFAAAYVGAVLVNINPANRAHELEYVLNQADITTLFLTDRFKSSDFFEILADVCPEAGAGTPGEIQAARCPKLRRVISIKSEPQARARSWTDFLAMANAVSDADLGRRLAQSRAEDVANIQ